MNAGDSRLFHMTHARFLPLRPIKTPCRRLAALILPNRKAKLWECGLPQATGPLKAIKHAPKVAWKEEATMGDER